MKKKVAFSTFTTAIIASLGLTIPAAVSSSPDGYGQVSDRGRLGSERIVAASHSNWNDNALSQHQSAYKKAPTEWSSPGNLQALSAIAISSGGKQLRSSQELSSNLQQEMLNAHNQWRKRYNVPPLRWSSQLASYARDWANKLAADGFVLRHRASSQYGENLFRAGGQQLNPTQVVNNWGQEVRDYNYASNSCRRGASCGHYTQIVWKNTKEVGCGLVRSNKQEIWVCNYNPPGNYTGQKPY
jgi:uncharacterized protein YkwD